MALRDSREFQLAAQLLLNQGNAGNREDIASLSIEHGWKTVPTKLLTSVFQEQSLTIAVDKQKERSRRSALFVLRSWLGSQRRQFRYRRWSRPNPGSLYHAHSAACLLKHQGSRTIAAQPEVFHPVCLGPITLCGLRNGVEHENASVAKVVERLCALRIRAVF
jgi:hypothetical protein